MALVLILPASVAFDQRTSGSGNPTPGPTKVYYRKEVFSYTPIMTYGALNTPAPKVNSGDNFSYSLSIGDADQWKYFYYDSANVEQYDLFTDEDVNVDFTANITSGTPHPVSSAHLANQTYTLTYTITAGPVEKKTLFMDTFLPTNQGQPVALARDPTTSNDVVRIYVEVSP